MMVQVLQACDKAHSLTMQAVLAADEAMREASEEQMTQEVQDKVYTLK